MRKSPSESISIALDEGMKVKVVADGRVAWDKTLPPTTTTPHVFSAHDRLEVDLPTLDGVRLRYNGEPLTPLGAQARPRRDGAIVEIADLQARNIVRHADDRARSDARAGGGRVLDSPGASASGGADHASRPRP